MKEATYTIYGPSRGVGSFRAITVGFLEGLHGLGRSVFFQPTDQDADEEPFYEGRVSDVAILLGNPIVAERMLYSAKHRERYVMVAPNSDMVAPWIFQRIASAKASLLTPSTWGKEVLDPLARSCRVAPAEVVPHGLRGAFAMAPDPVPRAHGRRREMLHITSTASSRKGTRELLRAWKDTAPNRSASILTIHAPTRATTSLWQREVDEMGVENVTIDVGPAVDWNEVPAYLQQFDAVIQPSRAEGFGLVPLEALAAGVPVVATACTGHADFLLQDGQEFWNAAGVVKTTEPTESDDYDGARSPAIDEESLRQQLVTIEDHLRFFQDLAVQQRGMWNKAWAWPERLRPFVERIEGGGE